MSFLKQEEEGAGTVLGALRWALLSPFLREVKSLAQLPTVSKGRNQSLNSGPSDAKGLAFSSCCTHFLNNDVFKMFFKKSKREKKKMCTYNSAKACLSLMFASMFERPQMHCEFEKDGACHLQSIYSHSKAFQLVRKTFLSTLRTLPIPSPSTTLYLV